MVWPRKARRDSIHLAGLIIILYTVGHVSSVDQNSEQELSQGAEGHLVSLLKGFLQLQLETLDSVRSFLPESLMSGKAQAREDPLLSFHLIKRLTVDLDRLKDTLQKLTSLTEELMFQSSPSEQDFQQAALVLVRLQDTYELNMTELVAGRTQGMQSVPLTARDCLYLGKHSFNYGMYGRTIQWFQQALAEADEDPDFREEVQLFLSTAIRVSFFAQSQLHCFLSWRGHAYLKLQPIRVEELSRNPTVLQFHDILNDKECQEVQQLATPKLSQSQVQGLNGSHRELSIQRTSQTAWLQHHLHTRVKSLRRRVQDITGLSADEDNDHCEVVQVANYGAGGFYQPHFDYLFVDRPEEEQMKMDPKELQIGDRTATLMFYLSDVTRGGATVFPRLGIGLWPKKGSAVFWFNLFRNGSGDPLTLHGACPVLHGQKWVANYWFREKGQSFLRMCSLNSNE